MGGFLLRRALDAIPVLIGVTLVSFALIHLAPGDPVRILLQGHATPANVVALRRQLGLDRSLPEQYWQFIRSAATFSFGRSFEYQTSVGGIVAPRIAASAMLIAYSLLLAIAMAVPLAFTAALGRDRLRDHAIRLGTTVTFAMPTFWVGLVLALVVSLKLRWLPPSGYGTTFLQHVQGLTLPAIAVALYLSPLLIRVMRSSLIDTLSSEYVEATRARGLSEPRVLGKHVLRNSLTSTVTLLGLLFAVLLSGTVVVENVFAIPGLGSLLVNSVSARDFPIIQALTLIFGVAVIAVGLLADFVYAAIDPRVRL
ncbi:MAG TPA: ABC transporter permease [Solirubrobacteraceae bacterium]|nr:ABC transporter permease [Solirubrobacteraceae bacterium]